MLQRIDIGDAQRVRDQRSRRRTTARTHRNVTLAGVADEIPDDQEVSGELHLLDDGQFPGQPLLVFRQVMSQPALRIERPQSFQAAGESLAGDVLEVTVEGESVRHVEVRKRIADFFQPHVAAFGNAQGAAQHVGRVLEDPLHFVVTLDEEVRALELHAVGVLDRLAGLDAEHHVLRVGVVLAEIVAVVRCDQRQAKVFFQAEQIGMDAVFLFEALVLNFEKEVVLSENVVVGRGGAARSVVVLFHQTLGNFAFQAP